MKIFVASIDKKFHELCINLTTEESEFFFPTTISEEKSVSDAVREDRLKILSSDVVIIDWDSGAPVAFLYWSCLNPNSKTIIVSDTIPEVDPLCADVVACVIKASYLQLVLSSLN